MMRITRSQPIAMESWWDAIQMAAAGLPKLRALLESGSLTNLAHTTRTWKRTHGRYYTEETFSPLGLAVSKSNVDAAKLLLQHDPTHVDAPCWWVNYPEESRRPLLLAFSLFSRPLTTRQHAMVMLLLGAGAMPHLLAAEQCYETIFANGPVHAVVLLFCNVRREFVREAALCFVAAWRFGSVEGLEHVPRDVVKVIVRYDFRACCQCLLT